VCRWVSSPSLSRSRAKPKKGEPASFCCTASHDTRTVGIACAEVDGRSLIPILWVLGSRDPVTRGSGDAFDRAPPHSKRQYVSVDADHLEVPAVAADQILTWLRGLDP
jgi:hypothetical protein